MKKLLLATRSINLSFKNNLKVNLSVLSIMATLLSVHANDTYGQDAKVTLNMKNASIWQILEKIENTTDYEFVYALSDVDLERKISVREKQQSIALVLNRIFDKTSTKFNLLGDRIYLLKNDKANKINAVDKVVQSTVTGTVLDELGSPLPGTNIIEKGSTNGTQTDFDGNFSLKLNNDDAVLVFSYIGYKTQEITMAGQQPIRVQMEPDAAQLEEVVLLGYGKQIKKEDLTGAVSLVGAKDMEKTPLVNVDQALQGRASGVQITQSSGAPGAGFKIRVRGTNSITGNNSPLYVVDGLVDVDINSVNPNDIQSMSVLKDASSTAIYGNRGANGVIIIKTKQGAEGRTAIEFGTFVSFSNPSNTIDLLSPSEFISYANTKNTAASGNPIPVFDTEDKIRNAIANAVNYQDEVYRSALANNYQLSFRGGTEKMNYFVSGNYLNQDGIAINTNFKRYALRSNINADLSERLKLSTSINLIRQIGFNNNPDFGAGLALGAVGFDPTTPIYSSPGVYNLRSSVRGGIQESVLVNPVFLARETERLDTKNRIQSNVKLNYMITDQLSFNMNAGIDYSTGIEKQFNPANDIGAQITGSQASEELNNTQYNLGLTYDNVFNDKHNVSATVLFEQTNYSEKNFNANGVGFFTPSLGFDNLSVAEVQNIGSSSFPRTLRSLLARATYNYDSKYLLTASVRRDESSVFPINQSGIFPAFAVAWNINNEDFFNSEDISTLKLRAGWGLTGNQNIGPTAALDLLRNNPWYPNGTTLLPAILPNTALGNPLITWETTAQSNIGLDVGILNNRFNFVFEYYIKNTQDLLLDRQLPRYTGRASQTVNGGEVENKGFDITLSGYIFQKENFSWDFSANLSRNRNEVLSLIDGENEIFPNLVLGSIPAPAIVRVGEPIGTFYGYEYLGVDSATGNALYADEQDIIGDPNPDFTYGLNNTMSFKNFDLNFFIQGVQGNDVFNRARSLIIGRDGRIPFGTSSELRNTWTAQNTSAPLPSLNATNTQSNSSEFVEDGSFLRLKNISLGYNLREVSALESIGLESVRFYVSGQNLITITDYSGLDPEVGNGGENDRLAGMDIGALPTPRTVTFGLNAKF